MESFGTIACFPTLNKQVYAIIVISIGILLLLLNFGTFLQVSKQSRTLYNQIKHASLDAGMKVLETEKKMGKMTALITVTFFLMYIPITLVFLTDPNAGFTRPTAVLVTDAVAFFLVIMDPIGL